MSSFFVAARGDTIKILWYDGDGLCLLAKRLERGRFVWPQAKEGTVSLTRAQLSMLLEGIDWRRARENISTSLGSFDPYPHFFSVHAAMTALFHSASWHTEDMAASILPDLEQLDVDALKALVIELHHDCGSKAQFIEHQRLMLDKLRKMLFGKKSESCA